MRRAESYQTRLVKKMGDTYKPSCTTLMSTVMAIIVICDQQPFVTSVVTEEERWIQAVSMHKFGDEQNRLHIPIHQVNYPSPLEQW